MSHLRKTTWLALLAGVGMVWGWMPGLACADEVSETKAKKVVVDFFTDLSKGDAVAARKLLSDDKTAGGQFADAMAGICKSYADFDKAVTDALGKGDPDPYDPRTGMLQSIQNAPAASAADGSVTVSPGETYKLTIKKTGDEWKITEAIAAEDFQKIQPALAAFKTVTEQVAADVHAGKFTSRANAQKALQDSLTAAARKPAVPATTQP